MIPGDTLEHDEMSPWGVLSSFAQENTVPILTALQQNPVQHKTELTDYIGKEIDSSTISEIVGKQRDRGLVRCRPDRNQYETTPLGDLSLQVYNDLVATVEPKAVDLLAKSQSVITILEHLDDTPASLAELTDDDSICVERSTISNYLSELDAAGWIERKPPYESSKTGTDILDAYHEYADQITCLAERRPFLQYFDMEGLPLEALHGTKMVAATKGDTDAPTQAYVDSIDPDFEQVLGVTPTTNKQYVQAFLPLIRSNCEIELVADRSVLRESKSTYMLSYASGLLSSDVTWLVSDEPITAGIAIFDRETVWLGAYGWARGDRAVLTGSNDTLLNWALNEYEAKRELASPPPKTPFSTIKEVLRS